MTSTSENGTTSRTPPACAATLWLVVALSVASCSSDSPTSPGLPPADTTLTGPRTIVPGQVVSGTITGAESECRFVTSQGGWGGVCDVFDIAIPSDGNLETTVRWSGNGGLVTFVKTVTGTQIDMACCGPPLTLQIPVEAATSYRLELAYAGRPPGYPSITPVSYVLETRLLAPGAAGPANLRTILFAEASRTQRLSFGRVELLDGPRAGSVAVFDPVSGTYDLRDLPSGYARIRVSADGFLPATIKVPIGVSVPQEIVLTRLAPLEGAVHSLGGMLWASENSAYGGVKVEILDGPHAGAFTFSDDDFGFYFFQNLTPGLIHVRASREGLATLTQAVTVSGATTLSFRW
ncbi:MAG: hypothetical protein ACREMA_00570 [Longimicrobiales bacterium]